MRLDFQQKIASSSFTLPVVCVLSVVLWLVLPQTNTSRVADWGVLAGWQLLSSPSRTTWCIALAICALCVYLMAELNNRNALLRISSRMLSSTLALLCALTVCLHHTQPGLLVMLLTLLSLFPLFRAYQSPSPLLTFCVFTCISVASLVFAKVLLLVPLYWLLQTYLRSFSFRCFISSLLAIAMPWWICFGLMFGKESISTFADMLVPLTSWQWADYSQLSISTLLPLAFFIMLFVIGVIDFLRNSFLDKTHTRSLLGATSIHGLYIIICIALQPQHLDVLHPLLLIDTAIMFGHFFALTYTRSSHITCLVLAVLGIIMFHLSFFN